ncbi:hypothetical protein [Vibrio panuliri]|uniref:Uncharacterized protein n=1 Tax=Vibrio panuliri TaxID=1381081 RepID=A0A1Q9HB54_9VIBR|nr:hypothetical protein [Vibrio panuliri]KAB1457606.1 hypothetical protein F7O85_07645 [Vibrio panuliri]OLQ86396.1 hypothetical protein BIY22_12175 [Vibrio panuliri]OLQ88991.1 hypothetical protein BIY20_12065 [Vibrio panuliri]
MRLDNAIYQPHIQHNLKAATKFIDQSLKTQGNHLNASLNQHNQIQIRNEDGVVVKTFQGENVVRKMHHIDEYV